MGHHHSLGCGLGPPPESVAKAYHAPIKFGGTALAIPCCKLQQMCSCLLDILP